MRPRKFYVGSRKFDVQRVGFETGLGAGGFEFDTTQDGNRNGGHDGVRYGTTLDTEERLDLIAYLKQL